MPIFKRENIDFSPIEKLGVSAGTVAMMWFNKYSGFIFKTPTKEIIVDPVDIQSDARGILNPDIIFISHEHFDHYDPRVIKDLLRDKTHVLAPPHITRDLSGIIPVDRLHEMKPGDEFKLEDVKIIAEKAQHPSPLPLTMVLFTEDDIRIYHAIDSMTFSDMRNIGEKYGLDIAIVPIGIAPGTSPEEGVRAIELLKPKLAIPHHATGGFEKFEKLIKQKLPGIQVKILKKGEIYTYTKG